MALSSDQVLDFLKQHAIAFESFNHAPVMTCDAQAKELEHTNGKVTKNLFLRDKKKRPYLITALPETKIDLKVLSSRLGLGKGGISWGSEELLSEVLQVEPGCVTPLALANASASGTVLLIDQRLVGAGRFFVHPIVNSASVLLDSQGLDSFLKALGREPAYVDLEAEPKIDKDNPPDLKSIADAFAAPPSANDAAAGGDAASASGGGQAAAPLPKVAAQAATSEPVQAAAKAAPKAAAKKGKGGGADGAAAAAEVPSDAEVHLKLTDVLTRSEQLMNMVCEAVVGKGVQDAGLDGYVLRRLQADVQMQLNALKNAAFAAGYHAAKGEVAAYVAPRR